MRSKVSVFVLSYNIKGGRGVELMNLTEFGEEILRRLSKKRCDIAEVFIRKMKGISAESKDREIDSFEVERDFGIAIRVITEKRQGFAFTTDTDKINEIIDIAVESVGYSADDEFVSIPEVDSGNIRDVEIYDPEVEDIDERDIIDSAIHLEMSARDHDPRIVKIRKALISTGIIETVIMNSAGLKYSYRGTTISAQIFVMAEDNSDAQMGWDYVLCRRKADIDVRKVGKTAASRAIELLGSKRISSERVPVILDSPVAVDFLQILCSSLSSESVQKNRSFLAGKKGREVVSPIIDIIDDGTMAWMVGTKPVDDEGVPCRKKYLIRGGVLEGYMYNSYTARKDSVESTGNAVRSGVRSLPGIGPTNIFINTRKSRSRKELIDSVKKGMLIVSAMGVHTANPISGDFSVGVSGLWIENGEICFPVKEAVMSGNVLELFKKVEDSGDDLRFYGNAGSPSLLIEEVDISA